RLLVIERVDAVAVARTPEQLRIFRAHHLPDRATQALALRFIQNRELVEIRQTLLRGQDHRGAVVFADVHAIRRGAFEVIRGEPARREAGIDQCTQAILVDALPRTETQDFFAAPDQRARAPVREQLLRELRGPRDRHRRSRRQIAQQVGDLLQLQAHAARDPRLGHQGFVLARQIDRIDDLAVAIQQAAGAGQEHDLVRLQHADQFVGREIGIDVEDLALVGFAEAGDDRNGTLAQAGLDRREFDAFDLADQSAVFAIQPTCREYTR